MSMHTQSSMLERITRASLLAGLCTAGTACLEVPKEDLPPIAYVTATLNGVQALDAKGATAVANGSEVKTSLVRVANPAAGTLILDGTPSGDPEGGTITYAWWNTGLTRAVRFPTVMGQAGAPAPTTVDTSKTAPEGTGRTLTVQLPAAGKYVYSLYVTDPAGNISIPASVEITVP